MIHRLHEIIKKMRSDVRLGAASIYVLDELERRINQIDPLDGVYIDEDEIAVYDPLTGEALFTQSHPEEKTISAALAVRLFYTKGPEGFR